MNKYILAAMAAASSDINLMSCDKIEAMTKSHGMLNLALFSIANVIAEEVKRGADIKVRSSNSPSLPLDDTLIKAIEAAKEGGADSANAAFLSAVMLYFAGSGAQSGVNVGSRKIGAMARIAAKVDRCGVAAMPTNKWGNKVSGFPAVHAIYEAMMAGKLSPISGRSLPVGIGALFVGHGPLGEEIIFPQVGREGAKIATNAMLDSMAGAGMRPDPMVAAIFGAAATLEILHPDAFVPQENGISVNSPYVVGKAACEAAGLPSEMHLHITNEVFDTARLISDLGLILKDSGGITIPGMLTFRDLLFSFKEPISPFRLTAPPLAHISAEPFLVMKGLLHWKFDEAKVCEAIIKLEHDKRVDPEMSLIGVNIVSRAAERLRRGIVSRTLIKASDPALTKGLYLRAKKAFEELKEGKELRNVARNLDNDRKTIVEINSSKILSKTSGKDVRVEVIKIGPLGRKKEKWARFWVMDSEVDVEITIDGCKTVLKGLVNNIIPEVAKNPAHKFKDLVLPACLPVWELSLAANTIINATIPAAIAAAMGKMDPEQASIESEEGAYISSGVPGVRERAKEVASRAQMIAATFD